MPISTIGQNGLNAPITLTSPVINTVTSAASTALTLQSAGTTAITVDTSQNVGIGTTSPSNKLDVFRSTFGGSNTSLILSSVNSASAKINFAGIGYTVDQGSAGIEAASMYFSTYGSGALTERMRINSSGQLVMATSTYGLLGQIQAGITADTSGMNSLVSVAGDQNGGYPFGARGNSTNQGLFGFFNSSNSTIGSITKSGSNVAYNTSSDYRLKENITPMTSALAKVAQLKPVTYTWKEDGSDGEGFIAHELAEVCPQAVAGAKDAVDADNNPIHQGVDTSFLVATLTAAIQELKTIVDAQAAEIAELKAKVA